MIPVISSYMLIIFHLAYFNAPKEREAQAGDPQGVFCREEGNVASTCGRVEEPRKSISRQGSRCRELLPVRGPVSGERGWGQINSHCRDGAAVGALSPGE